MTHMRVRLRHAVTLMALAFTAACGVDSPLPTALGTPDVQLAKRTASGPTDGMDTVGTQVLTSVKVLGRHTALASSLSASAVIDEKGGTIRIPETGFSLWVPMGALNKRTKITVTAMAGSGVAYHFEPHGLKFNVPVWFTQDTKYTESVAGASLKGGYFKDDNQVNNHGKQATVDEIYQVNLDAMGMILFGVWHFSGYLVSCA
jgi:hypothetical protein